MGGLTVTGPRLDPLDPRDDSILRTVPLFPCISGLINEQHCRVRPDLDRTGEWYSDHHSDIMKPDSRVRSLDVL
jgi:hypothetical protein